MRTPSSLPSLPPASDRHQASTRAWVGPGIAVLASAAPVLAMTGVTGSKVLDLLLLQLALGSAGFMASDGYRKRRRLSLVLGVAGSVLALGCGALWANGYDVALYQIAGLPAACRRLMSL